MESIILKPEREKIIALIHREVVPAIGCTEPIAVALCVAKATELLGSRPKNIKVQLSANILKNAMGVGIPGTGMIGLPIAIALGALIGKSEYELEVLKDSTPEAVEEGKKMIASQCIDISLKKDITEKLYIDVVCSTDTDSAEAIISGGHTNFVFESRNGNVLLDKQTASSAEEEEEKGRSGHAQGLRFRNNRSARGDKLYPRIKASEQERRRTLVRRLLRTCFRTYD